MSKPCVCTVNCRNRIYKILLTNVARQRLLCFGGWRFGKSYFITSALMLIARLGHKIEAHSVSEIAQQPFNRHFSKKLENKMSKHTDYKPSSCSHMISSNIMPMQWGKRSSRGPTELRGCIGTHCSLLATSIAYSGQVWGELMRSVGDSIEVCRWYMSFS